jgi:hypothetical protein
MAHPSNKHERFILGMMKGLKRAKARWGHQTAETMHNNDPEFLQRRIDDYILDTKKYRDITLTHEETVWNRINKVTSFSKAELNQKETLKAAFIAEHSDDSLADMMINVDNLFYSRDRSVASYIPEEV